MGFFLGLDAGTQSVKAVVIDSIQGKVIASQSVNFERELPQYNSPNGVLPSHDGLTVHANPLMWLDALDLLLEKLQKACDLSLVKGISGSAQQHGTVYLNSKVAPLCGESLAQCFAPKLSRSTAPVWLDKSTAMEVAKLNQRFGQSLQLRTGSPAIERFSAAQIMKFYHDEPDSYQKTRRIHLVSSFLCSVLCGAEAPIDYGDGAGMNLLNLKTLDFDPEITGFVAPNLSSRLPEVVPSSALAGKLDKYFTKYDLPHGIPVSTWSGDNPNSLAGTGGTAPGTAVISLGTSDTFFAAMKDFKTDPDGFGHVFGNVAGGFMSLICFANGSLAREKLKNQLNVDWEFFDEAALALTEPGCDGKLFLPYFVPEITPKATNSTPLKNYQASTPAEDIRAILETQALSMKHHSSWQEEDFQKIVLTGGASNAAGLRQIFADVFQAKVEVIQIADSAALGAAMRVANTVTGVSLNELGAQFCTPAHTTLPDCRLAQLYRQKLAAFVTFERESAAQSSV